MTAVVVTFNPQPGVREVLDVDLSDLAKICYLAEVAECDRLKILSAADVVFAWDLAYELTSSAEFDALHAAKLIQILSAGVDGLPFGQLPPGVLVASNASAWAEPIAEHVLAMTLALAKRLPERHSDLQRGRFTQQIPNREIRGSVVGIVGFGGIGLATGKLFRAFGSSIHAITRTGCSDDADWAGTLKDLDALLAVADVVVLSIPLNRATRDLIGQRELSLMKPDAILINVARAHIIDEDALFQHLRRNPEFSTGLDVWWQEWRPEFSRRPLLELPNVLGSPHVSANTHGSMLAAMRHATANIRRALRNETVHHLADRRDYVERP